MPRTVLVQCPVCNKRWHLPDSTAGTYCDCHLYCSEGMKPRDCSTTEQNWIGQMGWPAGAHGVDLQEGDDVRHRMRYCSTHDKYIYRQPVFLEVDSSFFKTRLPKRYTVFPVGADKRRKW